MRVVYEPSQAVLGQDGFDFCPGCGYGSVVLALAEMATTLDRPPAFIIDIGCVDFMTAHLPGDVMMGPPVHPADPRARVDRHPLGIGDAGQPGDHLQ